MSILETQKMLDALRIAFKSAGSITGLGDEIRMEFTGDVSINYDELKQISDICNTTNIRMFFDSGWQGTDVTPGNPATFSVVVFLHTVVESKQCECH